MRAAVPTAHGFPPGDLPPAPAREPPEAGRAMRPQLVLGDHGVEGGVVAERHRDGEDSAGCQQRATARHGCAHLCGNGPGLAGFAGFIKGDVLEGRDREDEIEACIRLEIHDVDL